MKFSMSRLALTGSALLLAGCVSVDRTYGTAPEIEIADLTTLPAPKQSTIYRIGPQEVVEISVIGADALSGTYLTDEAGNLEYPLLGTLPVAGLSPAEASRMIEDRLRGDFLRDPQVRLIPEKLPELSVSIGGQVNNPGNYPANAKLTLLRAVNMAGGLGEYAQHDDVLIMRTVEGQSYIGLFNMGAVERGNYPDPQIYPDDIVMVGDSPRRRQLDRILAIAAPVVSSTAVIFNQLTR